MSKKIRQQYGTQIGGAILGQVVGSDAANVAASIAQTGFNLANLKYSRDDESEADHMGLIFAAMAGYNPETAISFWQRMAASSNSGSQSDFLSDHPSDAKRIAAIQKELPEAMKYYQASGYAKTTTTKKTATKKTTTKKTTTKRRR